MLERIGLEEVLSVVRGRPGCQVLPAAGMPSIGPGEAFPGDLAAFYSRCGGLLLFQGAEFPWRVSGPGQLVPAGPRLLGEQLAAEVAREYPRDLTAGCYVIADDGTNDSTAPHVVIDLSPARAGRCYTAFWDTFGLAGEMPVVALNMTDLVTWLLEPAGAEPSGGDRGLGDAYGPAE